jgi:hypothetical protein
MQHQGTESASLAAIDRISPIEKAWCCIQKKHLCTERRGGANTDLALMLVLSESLSHILFWKKASSQSRVLLSLGAVHKRNHFCTEESG